MPPYFPTLKLHLPNLKHWMPLYLLLSLMNPPDLPKYLPHSQNCPLSLRSYLLLSLNWMQRLQKKLRRLQKYSPL